MRLKHYLFALLTIGLISCSNDNDDSPESINPNTINVTFPLANGNYWNYDVDTDGTTSRDSIYIDHDTIINSITYKKLETESIPTGFYSSSLRNNALRFADNTLLLTGDLSFLSGQAIPVGLDLSVTDFVILNNNASNGTLLSSKTGTISQTMSGFPVTMNYTLKTIAGNDYSSLTINGITYQNLKSTQIILTASVSVSISGISFPILTPSNQDVMVSEIIFADGIGAVSIVSDVNATLDPTVATTLGFPQSTISQHQEEMLDTYNVN